MQERTTWTVRPNGLGGLLRQHREARGLLQEELAALVEPPLSVNTIGNVERGRTRPHRHTLATLVTALGLDAEQTAELLAAWHACNHQPLAATPSAPEGLHALPRVLHAPSRWPGHNLPPSTTRLIGREHELAVISTQLQSPAVQLLTLTGAGGIGKSRLALAAAATLVDDFVDGVWFVPLAPVANPNQVVAAIAEALDLPDAGGHLRQNVREFLARRRLLLLLDNFEHLKPAAPLVAELIGEAPGLKVLVTSREVLHLSIEHTLEVPPLRLAPHPQPSTPQHAPAKAAPSDGVDHPPPHGAATVSVDHPPRGGAEIVSVDHPLGGAGVSPTHRHDPTHPPPGGAGIVPVDDVDHPVGVVGVSPTLRHDPTHPPNTTAVETHTPAAIHHSDAVQLFLERARAVEPDLPLTSTSALTIADICRQLDGLPLAIELAAARVKHVGLEHLSRLLERRLAVLIGGAADLPARQQTLRGAIAWSYDLLTPAEQAVFRGLSVFAGGCTLEAAEAVCAQSGQTTIDVLNRLASLIDKSLLRFEPGARDQPRYTMLETVREFGLEQLAAAGEEAATRERHATYCLDLGQQAAPHFLAAEQLEWLARVDDELDNVRACLAWLLESNQFERGQRLTGSLWYFWSVNCRVTEGREWLTRFLDDSRGQATSVQARASAYVALSFVATKQDDVVTNYETSTKSLALARVADDLWLLGMALARVAFVTERMDTRTIAPPGRSGGAPASTAVDVAELYDEALGIFRSLHDSWATAQCLVYYARFLTSRNAGRARALILEAIDIVQPIGERNTTGMALATLANLTLDAHDAPAARRLVEESLAMSDELKDLFNSSQRLATLAQMAIDELQFGDALDLLERCATYLRLVGNRHRLAHARHDLAIAARMAGDPERALHSFQECRTLFEELGLHAEVAAVMASLGHLQRQQRAFARSAATLESSWRLLTAQGVELGIPTVLAGLGGLALEANQPARAACLLGAAEALMARLQVGPEGVLNTTRPSLRGYQLRRDAAHVRELRGNAERVFSNSADAFVESLNTGRALSTVQACAFGLDSASAPTGS